MWSLFMFWESQWVCFMGRCPTECVPPCRVVTTVLHGGLIQVSKETHTHTCVKRDLHKWKETWIYQRDQLREFNTWVSRETHTTCFLGLFSCIYRSLFMNSKSQWVCFVGFTACCLTECVTHCRVALRYHTRVLKETYINEKRPV